MSFTVRIEVVQQFGNSYPVGYQWNHGFRTIEEARDFAALATKVLGQGETLQIIAN